MLNGINQTLNVLLVVWGSSGDVVPFIAIGSELRKRGYRVTLLANPIFESQAAATKLFFAPVGNREEYAKLTTTPELWDWKQTIKAWLKHIAPTWASSIKSYYEMILELYQPGKTVLIGYNLAPAARIAQEKLGIPMATLYVLPYVLPSSYDLRHPARPMPLLVKQFGARGKYFFFRYLRYRSHIEQRYFGIRSISDLLMHPVNEFRATLGLPPIRQSYSQWVASPQRIIGAWPDWFDPRQAYWPKQLELTGFPMLAPAESEGNKEIGNGDNLKATLPIIFTTGSVACAQNRFFACAIKACEILDRQGLLVTPHADQIPWKMPSNVAYVEHAPFDELFPRSAAVVHHGGIGTTACALYAGIPQVVFPMASDQFNTAERIEQLGVGKMITGKYRPDRLATIIRSLLESAYVAERCKYWQARVDPSSGINRAADLVEMLFDRRSSSQIYQYEDRS